MKIKLEVIYLLLEFNFYQNSIISKLGMTYNAYVTEDGGDYIYMASFSIIRILLLEVLLAYDLSFEGLLQHTRTSIIYNQECSRPTLFPHPNEHRTMD